MLKRHLSTAYGMTPDDYRAKWKLPADYPMVAELCSAAIGLAKTTGLGRRGIGAQPVADAPVKKVGRPRKTA